MQVRWLKRALKNLDEEAQYIARDDPEAAAQIVERIATSVDRLATHPASGRPGRVAGTRELMVNGTPYLVPYRVRGETVEILRVFHGARKWPKEF
ncbi:MAG: type II toxin-antitoxin system RelE/ParE family toxin [Candidatus Binataceae bacterium]